MRISVALGLVLAGLALPTQNAAAQFIEKKVLTLAAAQRISLHFHRRSSVFVAFGSGPFWCSARLVGLKHIARM